MFGFGFGFGREAPPPPAVVASPAFPSTGLVAYWGFDDSLTDSVGSKVLTASGGNSYVTGKLGTKALQLTAGNDAGTNDATVLGYFAGACSFQMWVKAVTIDGQSFIGDEVNLVYTDPVLSFTYDSSGMGGGTQGGAMSNNTWHHIVVASDGTNEPKMYLDGTLVATGDVSAALAPSMTVFRVGNTGDTSTVTFDGVAIWNVELDATKVSALWNSGNGNSP